MTSVLGLPVPHGFTISTDACRAYMADGWPEARPPRSRSISPASKSAWAGGSGTADDPLPRLGALGAKFSMPGMMDTVLTSG